MKLTIVRKEGMGCIAAGIRFAKNRLKRMKTKEVLCLITFYNGHTYIYRNNKGKLILPTDKTGVLDKAIDRAGHPLMNIDHPIYNY